jgi:hypothetical protein
LPITDWFMVFGNLAQFEQSGAFKSIWCLRS